MYRIVFSRRFRRWFDGIVDDVSWARIGKRIERLADGNFGDHRSVGGGVSELRLHSGPGYRVYYAIKGRDVVLLLCGGDKSSQDADIAAARRILKGGEE